MREFEKLKKTARGSDMGRFVGFIVLLFLLNGLPGEGKANNYIREEGYCMWYGQCGTNPSTNKPINCLYNGLAKPVDGPKSREILARLCPEYAQPESKVCCDFKQLDSLQSGVQAAQQMMARCPACWKNFRELYCRMTCSPNGSLFLDPTRLVNNNAAIAAINYYVDEAFRNGLYNSCRNVRFPSDHKRIMNFMCGTTANKCTPLKFLTFMGDPSLNGVSPFLIQYPPSSKAGIKPMNANIKLCNESCSRQDCCDDPNKTDYLTAKIIFSLKPGSELNQRTCYRNFFTEDCLLTGTILRFEILMKVLNAQTHLMNMSVSSGSERVALRDFCASKDAVSPATNKCIVSSLLQYWQNDAKKLNECILVFDGQPCRGPDDPEKRASWGDHLVNCADFPYANNDTTVLHLPCKSAYGDPVFPEQVLGGYDGKRYADASLLYVKFAIKKHLSEVELEKAKAWEKAFVEYVKSFEDDDLQLAYVPFFGVPSEYYTGN